MDFEEEDSWSDSENEGNGEEGTNIVTEEGGQETEINIRTNEVRAYRNTMVTLLGTMRTILSQLSDLQGYQRLLKSRKSLLSPEERILVARDSLRELHDLEKPVKDSGKLIVKVIRKFSREESVSSEMDADPILSSPTLVGSVCHMREEIESFEPPDETPYLEQEKAGEQEYRDQQELKIEELSRALELHQDRVVFLEEELQNKMKKKRKKVVKKRNGIQPKKQQTKMQSPHLVQQGTPDRSVPSSDREQRKIASELEQITVRYSSAETHIDRLKDEISILKKDIMNRERVYETTIKGIHAHYKTQIEDLERNYSIKISQIEKKADQEKKKLRREFRTSTNANLQVHRKEMEALKQSNISRSNKLSEKMRRLKKHLNHQKKASEMDWVKMRETIEEANKLKIQLGPTQTKNLKEKGSKVTNVPEKQEEDDLSDEGDFSSEGEEYDSTEEDNWLWKRKPMVNLEQETQTLESDFPPLTSHTSFHFPRRKSSLVSSLSPRTSSERAILRGSSVPSGLEQDHLDIRNLKLTHLIPDNRQDSRFSSPSKSGGMNHLQRPLSARELHSSISPPATPPSPGSESLPSSRRKSLVREVSAAGYFERLDI